MIRVGIAVLVLLAGCTYGPPEERAYIENVAIRPGSYQFAVAVLYTRFRPPTGISAFPDGGKPRYLEKSAAVYLVDASTDEIVEIARLQAPEQLQSSFGVHLVGWKGARLYVQLSGCPGPECYGDLRRFQHFELVPGEEPVPIDARPESTDPVPGRLSRAPGEETYLRASTGARAIGVRTDDSEPFVDRYVIRNSGELVVMEAESPM